MAAITVTSFMYTILDADTSFAYIAAVNAARMLGTAMVLMPVTTAALIELPRSLIPHGTVMNNTMRQVAASMGTAVLVTIMTTAADRKSTRLNSSHVARSYAVF